MINRKTVETLSWIAGIVSAFLAIFVLFKPQTEITNSVQASSYSKLVSRVKMSGSIFVDDKTRFFMNQECGISIESTEVGVSDVDEWFARRSDDFREKCAKILGF